MISISSTDKTQFWKVWCYIMFNALHVVDNKEWNILLQYMLYIINNIYMHLFYIYIIYILYIIK